MQFSAEQIATFLHGEIIGNKAATVSDIAPIENGRIGCLSYVCDEKYVPLLEATRSSLILMNAALITDQIRSQFIASERCIIAVTNAREAIAYLLGIVAETMNPRKNGIEEPVHIGEGTTVGEDVYIGAFAYIGKDVKLGRGVQIYPQVYIGDHVTIGDNTILYAGVKVYYNCEIGRDCILHAGCVIGADGFGFEPNEQGVNQKIPQIGNVVIGDDVELGANTCVDRAMLGSTIVEKNTKVDNLVQIAHNDRIGESSFLCAQVGIAGSTTIGKHNILAGQVGVAGHISTADNVICGAQSGVAGTIKKSGTYMGSPAIDAYVWRRAAVKFKQSGKE